MDELNQENPVLRERTGSESSTSPALREVCADNVQSLVRWAATTRFADIPPAVLSRAARIMADDLAAIIGARDEPEVARFHGRILERQGKAEATVWRGGFAQTDRLSAAVANAVAADWLELDEGYRPTPCHAGLYVLPALLAEAEATGVRCGDVLHALVIGYEIVTRIARSWVQPVTTMQSHGRYGAIGAAAGVGIAMRLNAEELGSALGAAATLVGPAPRGHLAEGVLIRNAWPASGAWNGMMAIEWAACGLGGVPQAFFDVYCTVLGGRAYPENLTRQLGESWAVLDGYTKIYACCQHLHSAVEAAIELRAAHPEVAATAEIGSVSVQTHTLALPLVNAAPHTTLGSKFSMPHAVAAALATGDAGADSFSARALRDAAIARLRGLVTTSEWLPALPPPNDRPARLIVTMRDGKTFQSECISARGGPDRPLPPDAWVGKMRSLATPVYPAIVAVFEDLVGCERRRLDQPWREVVREITGRNA